MFAKHKSKPWSRLGFYIRKQFTALLACFMVSQLYIFLHEAGHALASLALGYQIASFQGTFLDNPPHVSIWYPPVGGLRPLVSLAGTVFPSLAWLLFLVFSRRSSSWVTWIIKLFSTIIVLLYTLDWAIEPLFYHPSPVRQANDVLNFLYETGFDPRLVSGISFLASLAIILIFYLRVVHRAEFSLGLKSFRWCRYTKVESFALQGLIAIFTASMVTAAAANWASGPVIVNMAQNQPPDGYHLVLSAPLREAPSPSETIHEFAVKDIRQVNYFIVFSGKQSPDLEVHLEGPIGPKWTLLSGNLLGYPGTASLTHVLLIPGTYRLVVSPGNASGVLGIFTDTK